MYSPCVKKRQAIESAFETAASESKRVEESARDYDVSQTVLRSTLAPLGKCAIEKQTVPTKECSRLYESLACHEKVTTV